jgi:hypothetical protein
MVMKGDVTPAYCLVASVMLVCCWAYTSALKMEVTCSAETSVAIHRATWRYITEDRTP